MAALTVALRGALGDWRARPLSSAIAGRLLMRVGYRPLALVGGSPQLAAVAYLTLRVGPELGTVKLAAVMFVAGVTASGAIKAG